jgi:hypothetical protein
MEFGGGAILLCLSRAKRSLLALQAEDQNAHAHAHTTGVVRSDRAYWGSESKRWQLINGSLSGHKA